MAVEVGTLVVELEARVAKLESGMKRGARSISRFEKRAKRAFKGITRSFLRLGTKFLGITALIAAAAGAFSFVAFIKGSIDAAAAVDGFEIRLRVLIGSTQGAADTLAALTERARKVAPQLRDIIEAAATLGTVALGSGEKIEKLTDTALNISAVTGLTLTQTAQNLQRALSAGLGAADLFRERGVRALVEALTGASNLIEAPFDVVEEKINEVFGPGGIFGEAANQFAATLPGAISRTQDALFNLRAAFGEAITPALLATLNEFVIKGIDKLSKLVRDNDQALSDLARRGIKAAGLGFIALAEVLVDIIEFTAKAVIEIKKLNLFLLKQKRIGTEVRAALAPGGEIQAGTVTVKIPSAAEQELNELNVQIAKMEEEIKLKIEVDLPKFEASMARVRGLLREASDSVQGFGKETEAAAAASNAAAKAELAKLEALLASATPGFDPRILRETQTAMRQLDTLLNRAATSAAKGTSEFEAQRIALDQEAVKIDTLVTKASQVLVQAQKRVTVQERLLALMTNEEEIQKGEVKLRALQIDHETALAGKANVLLRAEERRAQIADERQASLDDEVTAGRALSLLLRDFPAIVAEIATHDKKRADEMQRQLDIIILQNPELAKQLKLVGELVEEAVDLNEEFADKAAEEVAETLASGITSALQTVFDNLRDPAAEWADFFADISASLLDSAINSVLNDLEDALTKLFKEMDLGGGVAAGILGGLGLAVGFIAGAMKDTVVQTSADIADSVVDDVQKVRGIVAGPTQIGIAEVGETIEASFVETNAILRFSNELLERILIAAGGSGAGLTAANVTSTTETALGATGPSLV